MFTTLLAMCEHFTAHTFFLVAPGFGNPKTNYFLVPAQEGELSTLVRHPPQSQHLQDLLDAIGKTDDPPACISDRDAQS